MLLLLAVNLSELVVGIREHPALSVPATSVAVKMLARRHRQLRQRAKRLVELSETERHELRIAAKKMRYTAESFSSLFAGGKLDNFLRRLGELQDVLGVLNDLATTRGLLSALAAGAETDTRRALRLCASRSAELEQEQLSELARCWKRVQRTPRFWPDPYDKADPVSAKPLLAASP
jgi:triphosphatase